MQSDLVSKPLQLMAQTNPGGRPWSDAEIQEAKDLYRQRQLGNHGGQSWIDPTGRNASTQPFNAPTGGYSSPHGYGGSSVFNSGTLPGWSRNTSQPGGIITSHMVPPTLPEGLVLPFQLDSSIDVDKAQPGDYVQGHITQNVTAGGASYLPSGSVVSGTIAKERGDEDHFKHAGKFSINLVQVRLPNGTIIPMKAHLVGRIGNYLFRDTTSGTSKMMSAAWRSGVGSELTWGTGSTFSALSSGSHMGPGGVAYGGALMGGATELLEAMFLHHGQDTFLHPGTQMELQLDSPLDLPGFGNHYTSGTGHDTSMY